ncbi:MAG: periplasmic heavy metal sensor [Caulobacteraceae bacterium]|nr:periplasmic heavy metal sensor [Caulobacteraceae bacterium]
MGAMIRTLTAGLLATALVASAAGWAGVRWGLAQAERPADLDRTLHHDLNLTPQQDRGIEALEARFAVRRAALDGEMRAANRDLAQAITSDHAYSPRAEAAIGRLHAAMGALQRETIQHLLAMRAVLTPAQATRFDQAVTKALTGPA